MKIRYIQSVGGEQPYQAGEKDKGGKYVWHDADDLQAVRYIDALVAVYQNKEDYEKAKANYPALEAARLKKLEITETLQNIGALKLELESKKKTYSELSSSIKEIDAKIKAAEATVTPQATV